MQLGTDQQVAGGKTSKVKGIVVDNIKVDGRENPVVIGGSSGQVDLQQWMRCDEQQTATPVEFRQTLP